MASGNANIAAHEILLTSTARLKWETEMGIKIMHTGELLFIPKGSRTTHDAVRGFTDYNC